MKIEGPYKSKKDLRKGIKSYITILKICIIIGVILTGAHVINQLDRIMSDQADLIKTQSDAMDQLMWIRQDIDELKNAEAEIADLSDFNLSEDERTLVERIVASESRGESVEGMAAVAQVIRDRSQLWGMTVTEVCLAPSQFANPYQGEIGPEVVQAVSAVFDEGLSVLEVPTTHFHADWIANPYWTEGKINRGQIGCHRFYY